MTIRERLVELRYNINQELKEHSSRATAVRLYSPNRQGSIETHNAIFTVLENMIKALGTILTEFPEEACEDTAVVDNLTCRRCGESGFDSEGLNYHKAFGLCDKGVKS